jgi:hypothetical protein
MRKVENDTTQEIVRSDFDPTSLALPDSIIKKLTEKTLGDDGDPQALVMLMSATIKAIKDERLVAARNTLFHIVEHTFNNNMPYVNALMDYYDRAGYELERLIKAGDA